MDLIWVVLITFGIIIGICLLTAGVVIVVEYLREQKIDPPAAPEWPAPVRRKPPAERTGETHKVIIEGINCFITANEYDDGSLCEVFVTIDKHGAEMRLLDEVAIFLSVGLQYGISLDVFVKKMRGTRIGTKGLTDHPEFKKASSVLDFLAQWLEDRYLKLDKYSQAQ